MGMYASDKYISVRLSGAYLPIVNKVKTIPETINSALDVMGPSSYKGPVVEKRKYARLSLCQNIKGLKTLCSRSNRVLL
jgi:hypothetical protein